MRTHRSTIRKVIAPLAAALLLAAACTSGDSDEPSDGNDAESPSGPAGHEAPMLAELVEAGDLPPLEERLPGTPLVVEPVERVGSYGGTWRTAMLGAADTPWFARTVAYEQLMRWDPTFTEPIPNIAESVDVNTDATEFTFHLREGTKWSDGEPFTANDIMFWYEDVVTNEQLAPVVPSFLVTGGQTAVAEMIDDYTIRFTFPGGPNGMFLARVASGGADIAEPSLAKLPRHYLEQFHADYNPNVDDLVAAEGVEDWTQLFQLKAGIGNSVVAPDLPTLNPWVMQNALGEGTTVTFERNPYYWKTDPDGNQLPYIDEVVFEIVEDTEVLLLNAINGELDMHQRHIGDNIANKPVVAENQESGDYHMFDYISPGGNQLLIALNLMHKDETMREVFQNKDFRIGLSHAINRQEIIDAVYARQGEPSQPAPPPGDIFYNEELATQYTEYDVDLANEHLDAAGYTERDSDGFRLGPDGERISFDVSIATEAQSIEALELVVGYWQEVGIDARTDAMDRSLFTERQDNNDHDALIWWGPPGGVAAYFDSYFYLPSSSGGVASAYAKPWAWWYEGDPRGVEPPDPTKRQLELFTELNGTADVEQQQDLMRQIIDIAVDQFYVMGVATQPDAFGIVKNNFHNVPEQVPNATPASSPALTNPEQYFIEE